MEQKSAYPFQEPEQIFEQAKRGPSLNNLFCSPWADFLSLFDFRKYPIIGLASNQNSAHKNKMPPTYANAFAKATAFKKTSVGKGCRRPVHGRDCCLDA